MYRAGESLRGQGVERSRILVFCGEVSPKYQSRAAAAEGTLCALQGGLCSVQRVPSAARRGGSAACRGYPLQRAGGGSAALCRGGLRTLCRPSADPLQTLCRLSSGGTLASADPRAVDVHARAFRGAKYNNIARPTKRNGGCTSTPRHTPEGNVLLSAQILM